jgi:hypothetical protein
MEQARRRLENHGMKICAAKAPADPGKPWGQRELGAGDEPYLAIATSHEALQKLFRDTRWTQGGWSQTFGRVRLVDAEGNVVEGKDKILLEAKRRVQVRIAGKSTKATLVPIAALLDELEVKRMSCSATCGARDGRYTSQRSAAFDWCRSCSKCRMTRFPGRSCEAGASLRLRPRPRRSRELRYGRLTLGGVGWISSSSCAGAARMPVIADRRLLQRSATAIVEDAKEREPLSQAPLMRPAARSAAVRPHSSFPSLAQARYAARQRPALLHRRPLALRSLFLCPSPRPLGRQSYWLATP